MLSVLNLLIGIGMAAFAAIKNPVIKGSNFIKNLGIELLGASSEFIGDGTQGLVGRVVDTIRHHRECKRLIKFFSENLEDIEETEGTESGSIKINKDINQIIKEIKNLQEKEKQERGGKSPKEKEKEKSKKHSETLKNNDVRVLMKMSIDLLFYKNVSAYLERSPHYKQLQEHDKEKADNIALLIEITVNTYSKDAFYKMPGDFKVLAYIITHTLKEHDRKEDIAFKEDDYERLSEKLSEKLLYLAGQNGGVINPQAIANAKYAPKYIMRACPGCGYDGPRILIDEKTNSVHCAACGGTYDVLQYAEPEICTEIDKKADAILTDGKEIKALIEEQDEKNKEQIDTLKELIEKQYKEQLTREYLDACLKGQIDSFEKKFKEIVGHEDKLTVDFQERISKVLGCVEGHVSDLKKVSDAIETLKTKNEEDRCVNAHLSQKLDSLGNQITSLYKYAQGQFAGLDTKSDLILEYIEKMCSKEYYEEMSNALGTDINKAISMEMKNGYAHIQALNSTSVSQIISAIEDLKKDCAKEGVVLDQDKIEKSIINANVQLSGQITGLQSLIEINQELINDKIDVNTQKTLSLLRIIIKGQDEIKANMLANAGLKMDRHDFERIYQGRIPSKYLINRGLPGPFPCPYCGVVEERIMNEEQYCRCSICGNYFLKVDPFQHDIDGRAYENVLKEDFGHDENEEWFATEEKIKQWRKKRTATVESGCIKAPQNWNEDGFYILPDCIDQNYYMYEGFARDIKILALAYGIRHLSKNFFNRCVSLQTIIFQPSIDMKYSFEANEIFVPYSMDIFGKSKYGDLIIGKIKN